MIPKLRFQEFEDSWSQVTIAEAASFRRGSFPQPYNIPQWYDDVNGMPFVQVVDVGNDFRLKPKTKQMISEMAMPKSVFVPKGSIVITIQGSIGRIALTQYDSYVDRTLLIITEKKLPLDDYFFIIALKKIFDYEKTIAVGGTIKTITKEKLAKFKFSLPHLSEQQRIGDFIRLVDQKINLLTKKKEALETYKNGLMQKIFSQELRFKREDGTDYPEWEIETLDKLCSKCKSGGTPKSTIAEYYNGNIPFLAISDITEQGKYLRSTSKSISELGIENSASWIVPKQSLIYSMYASVGFVSINLIPLATSQAVLNLIVDEKICLTEYLYYWLYQFQKNVHVYVTTGTQGNLNAQTVKSFQVDLPSIKEQEKITLTLSKIDEQISFMSTQIENTVTLKKGLLQQMFV